jgi:murein DD-endopeptidase MepM/ murein hydrolase activator NlpD
VRRLAQHAIAGVAFSAVVVVAAVAGLNSPVAEGPAIAVPAPVASITPSLAPASQSPTVEEVERSLEAARAEQAKAASRNAERAQLAASKQAAKRAKTLDQQRKSVAAEQKRIKAEAKAAAKQEAEEKAAQKRALANRGYEPGVTDPREIARQIMKNKFGYDDDDYSCFNNIIIRESMWKIDATNPSSGAYGIPQALPGSKMVSAGSDWRTNPATQIIWALDYMKKRYGSPCEAWSFKRGHGWY